MKITKSKLHNKFDRDMYWARIYFDSEEGRHTKLLISASAEYFWGVLKTRDFKEDDLQKWYDAVIQKWEGYGDKIFDREVHYSVHAITSIGKQNGLDFLKNEIDS